MPIDCTSAFIQHLNATQRRLSVSMIEKGFDDISGKSIDTLSCREIFFRQRLATQHRIRAKSKARGNQLGQRRDLFFRPVKRSEHPERVGTHCASRLTTKDV